jgi:hypothetical protein
VPYPLKGNLTLLDISNGIAGGNAALHIGNILPTGNELVTAQQYPWFLEPTIATAPGGVLWNTTDLDVLEARINASNVINEWLTNPDNGVASDWVVTFPTKGFHVDQFCNQIQANNSQYRNNGANPGSDVPVACATGTSADAEPGLTAGVDFDVAGGLNPLGPTVAPFEERFADGKSDITTLYGLFDREEGGRTASGTAPSPAPPSVLPLMPHEANVIGFTSADDPNSAVESPNVQPVDASAILNDAPYGWADLTFPDAENSELPVTGFMVKTRTFGTPDKHYGQIQNHGYKPAGAN